MTWTAEFATLATFLLLCITCYTLASLVLPVYLDLYAGLGWQMTLPVRLALGAGRPTILVGLFAIIMLFTEVRFRAPELVVVRLAVGGAVNLLLVLWLVGMSWTTVDLAVRMPELRSSLQRPAATAPAVPTAAADSARTAPRQ